MRVRVLGCSGAIARDCKTTSFLVDVQRASMEELDKWRREYPEAWNREYDRASGLKANAWVERGK